MKNEYIANSSGGLLFEMLSEGSQLSTFPVDGVCGFLRKAGELTNSSSAAEVEAGSRGTKKPWTTKVK